MATFSISDGINGSVDITPNNDSALIKYFKNLSNLSGRWSLARPAQWSNAGSTCHQDGERRSDIRRTSRRRDFKG
jgi:hypothetical protein